MRWEGLFTQHRGSLSDIGPRGCFVLTGGDVQTGELIRVEITLPNHDVISQWGEVVYVYAEIGFAVHFTFATTEEEQAVARLIAALEQPS